MGRPYKKRRVYVLPILGVVSEQSGPVAPTPQFRGWPIQGELLMAFTLTDSQQVTITVQITDKKGNPAKVDGPPVWLVDNPNVLALTPAADGMSCLVAAVGPLGTGKVSMTADADLGAGITEIVGVLDGEVTAGTATNVVLTPGAPTEQP